MKPAPHEPEEDEPREARVFVDAGHGRQVDARHPESLGRVTWPAPTATTDEDES